MEIWLLGIAGALDFTLVAILGRDDGSCLIQRYFLRELSFRAVDYSHPPQARVEP